MRKLFYTVKRAGILTAAAILGTAALAGCGSKDSSSSESTATTAASKAETDAAKEENTQDAQLVVAGSDGAGLIAAIQAAADGVDPSKILIVASGNELATDMASMPAYINAADTDEQFEADITDDFETYLSDILAAGNNKNNSDMAECVAENSEDAKNWLSDTLSIEFGDLTQSEGSSVSRSFPAKEGNLNEAVQKALTSKIEELKIPIEYNAELKSVEYNEEGVLDHITVSVDGKDQEVNCLALVATDVSLIPFFENAQVYETDGKATALVVSNNAELLNKDSGEIIDGLYAAGSILKAAVDGDKVLSGNELTEAVVFGTTAGTEAAVYISDNQ